jgi:RNA polymerase sigma-70 factor (ECF subfamily)
LTLLNRVKAGDPAAWDRLVSLYYPLVYGWCRQGVRQAEDAQDVAQEVFQTLVTGLWNFRLRHPGDTFRGWLRGVVRHKLQDYWRRQQAGEQAAGGDASPRWSDLPDVAADGSSGDAPAPESARLVWRALGLVRGEFEERTWQAFWRVTVDGESPADVAASLGVSRNAVFKAKSRVLARLRQELDEDFG